MEDPAPAGGVAPAMLHRGGCSLYSAQLGFINCEEAMNALSEPDIEACQIWDPQTGQ
ncbi:DUF6233 domain-containing protein [Streptomyces sp. NPDC057565]|uniref:DUF6233 domain-containing protein n=1 Tax=Streptomyces sp. NPDC057565 TaxID=3346169 RepID=UPI0036AA2769